MNTPTHSLLAMALLSKAGQTKRNWAVFIGSLLPDAVIYLWAPYQMFIKGESGARIWDVLYFEMPVQNLIALFNSVPIYAGIAAIGFWQRGTLWGKCLLFFSLAALVHMATDFPVHGHDAYRHFWPLSEWRFYSPFSYWEEGHHAGWVSLIEAVLALGSIAVLWRRVPKLWVKLILGLLSALYCGLQIAMRVAPLVSA
ncbi:MAG: hypothetical protein ACSHXY_10485 [Alphaproteobacteria bacterium]